MWGTYGFGEGNNEPEKQKMQVMNDHELMTSHGSGPVLLFRKNRVGNHADTSLNIALYHSSFITKSNALSVVQFCFPLTNNVPFCTKNRDPVHLAFSVSINQSFFVIAVICMCRSFFIFYIQLSVQIIILFIILMFIFN